MSRYLELSAGGGALLVMLVAVNFADRNVTPMPDTPDRTDAIAAYTAPPPSPLMAAVADGHGEGKYGLGREALPEEIAAWDVKVMPDGRGLPPGEGSVLDGEELFSDYCAACHGEFAEGVDNWPKLAGGWGSLADQDPVKTVGSYWPYLSTAWDYVHRSMPFGGAQTLAPDEVYAIVAYILYSNDMVDEDFVLSNENFLDVEMMNASGFFVDDRPTTEYPQFSAEPCMTECKPGVEITMRATVLDVTPDQGGADAAEPEAPMPESTTATPEPEAPAADGGAQDEPQGEVQLAAADPDLIAEGERVFRQCKACHQVGPDAKNRTGPLLNGILGQTAGSVDGYRYSTALKALHDGGTVWTPEALAGFLADPKGYAPGTKMTFRGLSKPADVAAVTAYIASFDQ